MTSTDREIASRLKALLDESPDLGSDLQAVINAGSAILKRDRFLHRSMALVGAVFAVTFITVLAYNLVPARPTTEPTRPLPIIAFDLGDVWFLSSSDGGVLDSSGDHVGIPSAWASNYSFSTEDTDQPWNFPTSSVRDLPSDGVLVVATWSRPVDAYAGTNFPARALPLDLADFVQVDTWEGQPSEAIGRYRLLGFVQDGYLEVNIFFGTPTPSDVANALADDALQSLQLLAPPLSEESVVPPP